MPESGVLIHGADYWNPSVASVERALSRYEAVSPGVFIPNWSRGTYGACAALSLAHPNSVRVIGFCHSDEAHYYRLLRYYEPMIHRFVAVSPRIEAKLNRLFPERAADIEFRNYPRTFPSVDQVSATPPDGSLRLIYVGRIESRQKRVFDLLSLAQRLTCAGIDFELTILGDGPNGVSFGRMCDRLPTEVRSRVRWLGAVNQESVAQHLRGNHVFLQASQFEGSSIALVEAMTQGCAPVVTRVSGAESLVRPGCNGELFESGDVGGLADLVVALSNNRVRLARLRAEAHRSASQRESWEGYVAWFRSLVEKVSEEPCRGWSAVGRPVVPNRGAQWVRDLVKTAKDHYQVLTRGVAHRSPFSFSSGSVP